MAPWRTVLAATDLGAAADEAIRQADEQARLSGAALVVLHVLPTWPGTPMSPGGVEMDLLERERLSAGLLATIAGRVAALTGRQPHEFEAAVDDGLPADAIVRRAGEARADLVVVGATGRTGEPATRAVLLGRVADAVVRRCPASVLVARPRGGGSGRLLVATDFSEAARHAVRVAAELQRRRGAQDRLVVVHAVESPDERDAMPEATLVELRACGEPLIAVGAASTTIPRLAAELGADLVVVGKTGRTGLRELLLGSVAEAVARSAPSPVLVVRTPDARRGRPARLRARRLPAP